MKIVALRSPTTLCTANQIDFHSIRETNEGEKELLQ